MKKETIKDIKIPTAAEYVYKDIAGKTQCFKIAA